MRETQPDPSLTSSSLTDQSQTEDHPHTEEPSPVLTRHLIAEFLRLDPRRPRDRLTISASSALSPASDRSQPETRPKTTARPTAGPSDFTRTRTPAQESSLGNSPSSTTAHR